MLAELGRRTVNGLSGFGDFCRFSAQVFAGVAEGLTRRQRLRQLVPELYQVGTLSVPVVMVTGAFVGMVLAVQTVPQFAAIGLTSRVGSVVNHSVLKELGPILAGIMLAGRVGGGLTAEMGTMHVTQQIDAIRAMGCDPIRVLVVPRFLACVLLIPLLVSYACFMGMLGGYVICVSLFDVSAGDFWSYSRQTVGGWELLYGPLKSLFFGMVIGLTSCFKGFRCSPGAAGVGRACTESFVLSCMAILALDLFLNMLLNTIYIALFGLKTMLV